MLPVIVALDFDSANKAIDFAHRLDPHLCRVKVGKELFTSSGCSLVESLVSQGFQVFLDLKYHDIPHTVARACQAAAQLGVWMVNVHALGGRRMMEDAREALERYSHRPLLIAVTLLTSIGEEDLWELGVVYPPQEMVLRLARLTQNCGLDGAVCSAQEASILKHELGKAFKLVTPGIRLAMAVAADDQKRVMMPQAALKAGADYLVIGRPITQAAAPLDVLHSIHQDIAQLL